MWRQVNHSGLKPGASNRLYLQNVQIISAKRSLGSHVAVGLLMDFRSLALVLDIGRHDRPFYHAHRSRKVAIRPKTVAPYEVMPSGAYKCSSKPGNSARNTRLVPPLSVLIICATLKRG